MVVYLIPFSLLEVLLSYAKILLWTISTALGNILSFVVLVDACLGMIHLLVIWGVKSFWAPENAWREVMLFCAVPGWKQAADSCNTWQSKPWKAQWVCYVCCDSFFSCVPAFVFSLSTLWKLGSLSLIISGLLRQEYPYFMYVNMCDYTWLLWGQLYSALVSYGAYL